MRPADKWLGNATGQETVSITVMMKPPAGLAEQLLSGQHPAAPKDAADPQMFAAVRSFASAHGLTVSSEDPPSRTAVLEGTVQQMNQAFGIEMGQVRDANGNTFLSYKGTVHLPPDLQSRVTAVLGLDQRPVARHASN